MLQELQAYFPNDGHLLDWDDIDWLDTLPYYIEGDDFICVHAGIPLLPDGRLSDPSRIEIEYLVHDRHFKEPGVYHLSDKCVLFGHTETRAICGQNKILAYKKAGATAILGVKDLMKVHLDTGAATNGVLGCFSLDNGRATYVYKRDIR